MKNLTQTVRTSLTALLLLFSLTGFAQKAISGKITDEKGESIPSVAVVEKGTSNGAVTDLDGNFQLKVADNATLVVSFVGYGTQEIAVGNQTSFNIILKEDSKTLGEVVVIGYGTQKKKDLTGSIVALSERSFQKGNIVSTDQLIAGKMAGVTITPNGGAPGSGSRIRIRGGSSLEADDPLIVVDGVPLGTSGIGGIAGGGISLINPNDIETITVLKDASAAAIYGSRASNGVIMITTKKGVKGQAMKIGVSSVVSMAQPVEFVKTLSGDEFRGLVNKFGNATQKGYLGNENTDWQSLIFRNAISHDENVNVSGTIANKLPYRASVGFLDQNGILLTSNMRRVSTSLNVNPRFFDDHLRVDLSYKGSYAKSHFADEGAIGSAISFDPTQKPYTDKKQYQGYFEWLDASGLPNTLSPRNPLGLLNSRHDIGNVNRHIANVVLDYKFHFLPDLRWNTNLGIDLANTDGTVKKDSTAASAFLAKGVNNTYTQLRRGKTLESYLNYVKQIGIFKADVMGGYGYQDFYFEGKNNFVNQNGVRENDTTANRLRPISQSTLVSFFGRANLGIKDRYLLTYNVRRDGSSKLAPGYKWLTYTSTALAWRMTEDGIGKSLFSDLKLRVGYGTTGQQDGISDYNGLKTFSAGGNTVQYPFGNTYITTLRPEAFNEQLTWQKTTTTNLGLDFTTKNERLSGSFDYYIRETQGLFVDVPVPAGVNFSNRIRSNVGTLEIKGFEITLNATPIKTGKLEWETNFVFARNNNQITKLTLRDDEKSTGIPVGGIGGGVGNNIQLHQVGVPKNSFYVFQQAYDSNGKPVEGLYVDRNADGKITVEDKYLYKKPDADYTVGFTSNLTYGDFNFGFVLRGSIGNYVYNNRNSGGTFGSNSLTYLYNPAYNVLETNFNNAQYFSDYYMENGSFLKMDNLNIGYDLTSLFKNKFNVRLSAIVQNVMQITKYTGVDPEHGGGIDNNIYPRPRTYSFGLNVQF